MTWARLEGDYYHDPKIRRAGSEAELLYVRSIAWCARNLTDGVIPRQDFGSCSAGLRQGSRARLALVRVGLWEELADGWRIPPETWARYQRTRAQVEEDRKATAERMRQLRQRKRDAVTPEPGSNGDAVTSEGVTARDLDLDLRDLSTYTAAEFSRPETRPADRDINQLMGGLAARLATPWEDR